MTGKDDGLELLTRLSRNPAPIRLLADDLLCSESRVRQLAHELVRRGYRVEIFPDSIGETFVMVPAHAATAKKCREAATAYYERVYETAPALEAAGMN